VGAFAGGVLIAGSRHNAVAPMTDGDGSVIASHPRVEDWIGRPIRDPAFGAAMRTQSARTLTTSALDGEPRIFGFLQVPGTGARIAIGLGEAEALGALERERRIA